MEAVSHSLLTGFAENGFGARIAFIDKYQTVFLLTQYIC